MNLHRVALLVTAAAIAFAGERASAHEFSAPVVTVEVSKLEPGGHPNLQTTIDTLTGAGFDRVMIISPKGSSIAEDAQIPDGTVVGRLDAEATTNALTRPTCDVHVTFSVPIVEATTDLSADDYPQYLKDLAPGRHRLRLLADVSPSPEIPVVINYLFDLDPLAQTVVSRVFVGDPDHPAPQLKTCTPQKSINTLFGITPIGTPLLTSPDPLPDEPLPFKFVFTSRPDEDGQRHEQTVAVAAVVDDFEPPALPPPPRNLTRELFGSVGRLSWEYEGHADQFEVQFTLTDTQGQNSTYPFFIPGDARSFDFGEQFVPRCGGPRVTYAVRSHFPGRFSLLEQIGPYDGCAELRTPAAPHDLRLQELPGGGVALTWQDDAYGIFTVQITHSEPDLDLEVIDTYSDVASHRFILPRERIATCADAAQYSYRVIRQGAAQLGFASILRSSPDFRCFNASSIAAPDAGAGPDSTAPIGSEILLVLVGGLTTLAAGYALLRTRHA